MTQVKSQLPFKEFLALPQEDITYELVDGQAKYIQVKPSSPP